MAGRSLHGRGKGKKTCGLGKLVYHLAPRGLPWVPEAFHARFLAEDVSARGWQSSSSHARRNLWYPGQARPFAGWKLICWQCPHLCAQFVRQKLLNQNRCNQQPGSKACIITLLFTVDFLSYGDLRVGCVTISNHLNWLVKTKHPIKTLFHSADEKPQHHQSYDLSKWLFWLQRTERSITHIIRSHPKHPAINMLTILFLCLWLNRCQLYVKRYLKSTAQLPVTASLSLPIINLSEHPQLSQLSKHKLYICFKKQPSYCLVCRNYAYHGCLILSTKSELNTCSTALYSTTYKYCY